MSAGRGPLGLPKLDADERKKALEDPGPSWREWLTSSFAKTYLALAFFIVDAILASSWLGPSVDLPGLIGTTGLALYLEFLAWQYLWYDPRPRAATVRGSPSTRPEPARAGPTWGLRRLVHPFDAGRWSETTKHRRLGIDPAPDAPDPREFV